MLFPKEQFFQFYHSLKSLFRFEGISIVICWKLNSLRFQILSIEIFGIIELQARYRKTNMMRLALLNGLSRSE